MADFGGEYLFAVFDHIETKKKDEKAPEVTESRVKDSLKRLFQQRGEKRGHDDTTDGASLDAGVAIDDGEKLKRAKKPDDER
jgi:hypothetical protein